MKRNWIKIVDRQTGSLVGYLYNPSYSSSSRIASRVLSRWTLAKCKAYKVRLKGEKMRLWHIALLWLITLLVVGFYVFSKAAPLVK